MAIVHIAVRSTCKATQQLCMLRACLCDCSQLWHTLFITPATITCNFTIKNVQLCNSLTARRTPCSPPAGAPKSLRPLVLTPVVHWRSRVISSKSIGFASSGPGQAARLSAPAGEHNPMCSACVLVSLNKDSAASLHSINILLRCTVRASSPSGCHAAREWVHRLFRELSFLNKLYCSSSVQTCPPQPVWWLAEGGKELG